MNENYRRRFGDRAHKHLFNGGALTTGTATANFQATADELEKAVIGESARWGDFRVSSPYTQADWQSAVAGKVSSWIPQRGAILLGQLRGANLYPDVDAPSFSPHGGQIAAGTSVSLSAPAGDIYYTLDGSDPMKPGASVLTTVGTTTVLLAESQGGWRHFASHAGLSNSDVVSGHPFYSASDWKHPSFNDSAWQSLTLPAGFGDIGAPPATTTLDFGGDPDNRYITYYFRRQFNVTNAATFTNVTLGVRRDDGIVAYFNGVEVGRSNMPGGVVTPTTTTPSS